MTNIKPLYITKVKHYDEYHLVVGDEIKTLCGKTNVVKATQTNEKRITEGNKYSKDMDFCSECKEKWDEIKHKVNVEPIIDCLNCRRPYSGIRARQVSEYGNTGSVCKRCYQKLKNDSSSNVKLPYEEASSPFEELVQ